MPTLKYVIVNVNTICGLEETGVIFSELMTHKHVAESLGEPVSAGVCWQQDNGKWDVGGESTSLGLKSREEDAAILNKIYGTQIETMADEFNECFHYQLVNEEEISLRDLDDFLSTRMWMCSPPIEEADQMADNGETFDMTFTFGDRSSIKMDIHQGIIVSWE